MSLTFYTKSGEMTFVDCGTGQATPAHKLQPNHDYQVYLVYENLDDVVHRDLESKISHTAFGIGLPGGPLPAPIPVDIPPRLNGDSTKPGLAVTFFNLHTPPGGHGCLVAQLVRADNTALPAPVPTISQNLDIQAIPIGMPSVLSFLVFGGEADRDIVLTVTETPAPLWGHTLTIPAEIKTTKPAPPGGAVVHVRAQKYYMIGLNVTANGAGPHDFHVVGMEAGTKYVGEVVVTAMGSTKPMHFKPDVFITGSYHSPDIVLLNNGNPVPMAANPKDPDTQLWPNRDYEFRAIVRNRGLAMARNTVVTFWAHNEGGLSPVGVVLDVQTRNVPPMSQIEVTSRMPFRSAPAGHSRCAAVTVCQAQSKHHTFYTDLPDPYDENDTPDMVSHSDCAWRNTDSMVIILKKPWEFQLHVGRWPRPVPNPWPLVTFEAVRVPRDWHTRPEVMEVASALQQAGARNDYPLFFVESLRRTLERVNLNIRVQAAPAGSRIEAQQAMAATATGGPITAEMSPIFRVLGSAEDTPIKVTGELPDNVEAGDIIMLTAKSRFPEARTSGFVEFTKIMYVEAE